MYDPNPTLNLYIETFLEATLSQQNDEENTKKVIELIKSLNIKDFQILRNAIDEMSNSSSLTYTIADVDSFLINANINLTLEQKVEILRDYVDNVSSYGDDWCSLFPLCIQEHLDKLGFNIKVCR